MQHEDRQIAPFTLAQAESILGGGAWPEPATYSMPRQAQPKLLRRIGAVDPESLESYRLHGGFTALGRAEVIGSDAVIREITESRLLGRGGAAFPTGRKWESVAKAAARPHYLVCNADESEPGTFKDRVLMENDPFAIVEGMAIAALATSCEKGFLYVRTEYPLARRRIENAIAQARAQGILKLEIEVRRGAGAYICGEETALFNSIEGKRGEPRNKPPFPVDVGLFGKPTLVNNVETLFSVLEIVLAGGAAFATIGTKESTGTRLFCVSGHVQRRGVYEVQMGTTLRELLELAGPTRKTQAVLLGGAAGSFVMPEQFDVPLSFEGTRAIGATLGSGAVIVFDDTADMKVAMLRIARFFRDESCGQCVPGWRGRARRRAGPGPRLLAQGRGGHEGPDELGAGEAQPAASARAPGVVRRHVAVLGAGAGLDGSLWGGAFAFRRRCRDRGAARQGRQRALCTRLLAMHPLLQVRGGVRRRCAEHLRDRRRRSRLRRPHLDRVRYAAAGVGVRVLRQLHRRVPDRGIDVQERARHARRRLVE